MKIIGLTRIRNESHIIADTLEHVQQLVDEIYIYDDCSTDDTVKICKKFPVKIIRNNTWEPNPGIRARLEGSQRNLLYHEAYRPNAWFYYFDADEFADFSGIDFSADAYRLRLYDYYITKDDINLNWKDRKWLGPEYRDILMLFKGHPDIQFKSRTPSLPYWFKVDRSGFVKHYGKAISVEEWEKTCQYYINHLNERGVKQRWAGRIGKAVHTHSDFGNELITWDDRVQKGVCLKNNMILI